MLWRDEWLRRSASYSNDFEWRNRRVLHVCVYADHVAAWRALEREIPSTMAKAPYAGRDAALIVVQSPRADPRNGDADRMMRILAHEITHPCVLEATGSLKRLGDGNRSLAVSAWLNEGPAEVVGHLAASQEVRLAEIRREAPSAARRLRGLEIDSLLDDLASPHRSDAFVMATAAVWGLAAEGGHATLFHRIAD